MGKHTQRIYVVVKGRKPGIYTFWYGPGGAYDQVNGFSGSVYRGFPGMEEARQYAVEQGIVGERLEESTHSSESIVSHPKKDSDIDVLMYTDGGCIRNPGPGGYGVIIISAGIRTEYSGGFRLTTNNRMELMACIVGLESVPRGVWKIQVFSDSRYVVDAIEKKWVFKWQANNWMRDKIHPAENADLWDRLLSVYKAHDVTFHWVRGHSGHPENERCDALAKQAALGDELSIDSAYEEGKTHVLERSLFVE
ncbi:MAG: ribonuclease HI [Desulfomonilia bacterium]